MREIKFRAWNKRNKDWADITLLGATVEGEIKMRQMADSWYELMQYTGLKDHFKAEIYEADLLRSDDGRIWEVVWYKDFACFKGHAVGKPWNAIAMPASFDTMEIIGNIYENPELLK